MCEPETRCKESVEVDEDTKTPILWTIIALCVGIARERARIRLHCSLLSRLIRKHDRLSLTVQLVLLPF